MLKNLRKQNSGRLPLTSRNMEICKMVDNGQLLKDIADQYNLSKSRITRIVQRFWDEYVIRKNVNKSLLTK